MSEVNKRVVKVASGATAVTLVGGGLVVSGGVAQAAVTDEAGLAAAITAANGNAGPDTIEIAAGTIVLGASLPRITDELTIVGAGQTATIIDGDTYHSVFYATDGTGTLTVEGMTIQNAEDDNGPAIRSDGNDVVITDVTFLDNRAVDYGGAVYVSYNGLPGDDLTITGSTFEGNVAAFESGGAVWALMYAGAVEITDSTFTDNESTYADGGAVAIKFGREAADVTISGSTFTGNGSLDEGGAVFLVTAGDAYDAVSITDSTFTANTTKPGGDHGGGAVFVYQYGEVAIDGSTFGLNRAGGYGGAVHIIGGDVTISASEVTENYSEYGGGALQATAMRTLTVQNSTFSGNEAGGFGGAIYASSFTPEGTLLFQYSTFEGNTAYYGGAIQMFNYGTTRVENSTFSGNSADTKSGALTHLFGTLVIDQSTFTGNSAAYTGGIFSYHGVLEIRNSTITGNSATADVGGVYLSVYTPRGEVAPPAAKGRGGAPQVLSTATVVNSIIWGNTEGSGAGTDDLGISDGAAAVDFSLIGVSNVDVPNAGSGNLFGVGNDPLLGALADNGGATRTMLPAADSPVVDAGDSAVKSFETDQRGEGRIQGDAIDIGAVEWYPEPVTTTTVAPTTTESPTTTEAPDTTAVPTTQGPTTTLGPAVLPPTGGGARTGVLAALVTGLGAVLTLGATRRRRID